MRYRRSRATDGTFFPTVHLPDRQGHLLTTHIGALRSAMRSTRLGHCVEIVAMAVLPDHLHAVWHLPGGDAEYPQRWSLITAGFSPSLPKTESIRNRRTRKRGHGIWQRRYREHQIRDDDDLRPDVDCVHLNPMKHGYVEHAIDWLYPSIHRFVREGAVSETWSMK